MRSGRLGSRERRTRCHALSFAKMSRFCSLARLRRLLISSLRSTPALREKLSSSSMRFSSSRIGFSKSRSTGLSAIVFLFPPKQPAKAHILPKNGRSNQHEVIGIGVLFLELYILLRPSDLQPVQLLGLFLGGRGPS